MNDFVISARGLIKSWRGRPVLDTVDLDLKRGSVTAILGPSGTGKSTLLRVIAGLETVDAGQVVNATETLTDRVILVPPERRNIGLVFQDFSLFPHLSALDNVLFGLSGGSAAAQRQQALDHLDAVRMADKAHAFPHTLSGGEQQRVALARALAPQPDVVLLDEAFSGLDAKLRVELRTTALDALRESGAAVLVVTHDAEEAMFMADNLALMADGAIIQAGSPDELYLAPQSAAAARLMGDVNSWTGVVRNGHLDSPFGAIATEHHEEGDRVTLLVRPEGVSLTQNAAGKFDVLEVHPLGAMAAITIRTTGGEIWQSRMPIGSRFAVGAKVDIGLVADLTNIVSADP